MNDYEPDEITVLDYFAAAAMSGVCPTNLWSDHTYEQGAANCYRLAEAMVAERSKRRATATTPTGQVSREYCYAGTWYDEGTGPLAYSHKDDLATLRVKGS